MRGIVPAIVEQEAIEFDPALFVELFAESANGVDDLLFGVAIEVSEVVPGVVVQECAIGMGALEFDVTEEVAAKLRWMSDAEHGGVGNALFRFDGQFAREPAGGAIVAHAALGE